MLSEIPLEKSQIMDCLNNLAAIVRRHPYLPTENLRFNHNFYLLLRNAYVLRQLMGEVCRSFKPRSVPIFGREYWQTEDSDYDFDRYNRLKEQLVAAGEVIKDFEFQELSSDLRVLKARRPKDFKRAATALLKLAPFIYNYQGEPLWEVADECLTERIRGERIGQVENLYTDLFTESFAPRLIQLANEKGMGQINDITHSLLNNFIPKTVLPAVKMYTKEKQTVASRIITLEEIAAPVSVLRGALAGDCSMVSVPYYSLLKGVHTFWVRKGEDPTQKPAGYVFVVEVVLEGQILPYIITVNGVTLTTADTQAAIGALAEHWSGERVLLPSLEHTATVVNTDAICEGFRFYSGHHCRPRFPEGWEEMERIHDRLTSMRNYYRLARDSPRLVKVGAGQKVKRRIVGEPRVFHVVRSDIADRPLLERAMLAYYATVESRLPPGEAEFLRHTLAVNKTVLAAVTPLMEALVTRRLDAPGLTGLQATFGFQLRSLLMLDKDLLAASLREFYDQCRTLYPDKEWAYVVNKTNRYLRETLENQELYQDDADDIAACKIALPDLFVPNYWQENLQYLSLPHGEPDFYRINRFVKYFTSYGTILPMLEFLDKHPGIVQSLDAEDPRWVLFLRRARSLLDGQDSSVHTSICNRIIEEKYGGPLQQGPARLSAYHFGQLLVGYCVITADDPLDAVFSSLQKEQAGEYQWEAWYRLLRWQIAQQQVEPFMNYLARHPVSRALMRARHWKELEQLVWEEPGLGDKLKELRG